MGASRLPGKPLLLAVGKPILELTVERLRRSQRIARLVVATSDRREDDAIAELCVRLGLACFRGSADEPLDRVYWCARHYAMTHIAYFGADNPLIDPSLCDEIIDVYLNGLGLWDYVTNNRPPTYPDGEEVEITPFEALETGWHEVTDRSRLQNLLNFLCENPWRFRVHNLVHEPNLHHERWTLDFPEDYEFLRAVFEGLYPSNPAFGMWDIIRYLDLHPHLRRINTMRRTLRQGHHFTERLW